MSSRFEALLGLVPLLVPSLMAAQEATPVVVGTWYATWAQVNLGIMGRSLIRIERGEGNQVVGYNVDGQTGKQKGREFFQGDYRDGSFPVQLNFQGRSAGMGKRFNT